MKERKTVVIPIRFILAIIFTLVEFLSMIAILVFLDRKIPYFHVLCILSQFGVVVAIIGSDDNPDYKVPWTVFVLTVPYIGFMAYFVFYSRKLKPKYIKMMKEVADNSSYKYDDEKILNSLDDNGALGQARILISTSSSHIFTNVKNEYFPLGELAYVKMIEDLKSAEKFIWLEYFIIEEGKFWNSILDVLKDKVSKGLDVKVIYDDVGCMTTLPGSYFKELRKMGIDCVPFSILRGKADSEFNNRSHRKIMVIDGKIGYTGGINLADEYINEIERFGHWKDSAIRLEGEAVKELTKIFHIDWGMNIMKNIEISDDYYPAFPSIERKGYVIPFGDGPKPQIKIRTGEELLKTMFSSSVSYMYMTSPYLILDNDMLQSMENAALRGVDVRIILPFVPDKKIIKFIGSSYYQRLISSGVRIYEYTPGFIHAKTYLSDDKYAMVGTINLDYRSLVHHFENGVWMYDTDSIEDLKRDFIDTMNKSREIKIDDINNSSWYVKGAQAALRFLAPLM